MKKIATIGADYSLKMVTMLAMMESQNMPILDVSSVHKDGNLTLPKPTNMFYGAANAGGKKAKERRVKQIARMPEHEKKRLGLI